MSYKTRESGIELLKVIAMILIVISHVTQSLGRDVSAYGIANDYLINLNNSTTDISRLTLSFFRYFGGFGNIVFFVCSAWFLADSKKTNIQKIIKLIVDIWVISVIMLIVFYISGIPISKEHIIKSFLPTTFSNNWYMTTYILFYAIHIPLNMVIENMNQKKLLSSVIILSVLYCGFGCLKFDLYCGNYLMCFITIYFIVCYMKKYMSVFFNSKRDNCVLLVIGIVLLLLLFLTTNILGLRFSPFSSRLQHWNRNNNILFILIAVSLLNIVRMKKFVNPVINYISSLSLLIYIIHENILVSAYFRTKIWGYLYSKYGHSYILLQVLVYSIVLFIVTAIISIIYQNTIMKITGYLSTKLYTWINAKYLSFYNRITRLEAKK